MPSPPYRWRFCPIVVTLMVRSCVARQEPYIPGALSILQGTVPGRVRGSGHMVPTYFRRELRDRALQRPSRLRTFLLDETLCPSCPRPDYAGGFAGLQCRSAEALAKAGRRASSTPRPRGSIAGAGGILDRPLS